MNNTSPEAKSEATETTVYQTRVSLTVFSKVPLPVGVNQSWPDGIGLYFLDNEDPSQSRLLTGDFLGVIKTDSCAEVSLREAADWLQDNGHNPVALTTISDLE